MKANIGIRRRLAPLLENDINQIELFTALLLALPGSPVLYYGDEIGMGDNIWLGDRDGVRTPMQWTPDRNAGFSTSDPGRLYLPVNMDSIYGYQVTNVESQTRNGSSLLHWTRRMIQMRKAESRVRHGHVHRHRRQQPVRAQLRARVRRRHRAVRQQPLALPAAGRTRPAALGGRRAGRAARRRALPAHRRAALPAHRGRARLLLAAHPAHATARLRAGRAPAGRACRNCRPNCRPEPSTRRNSRSTCSTPRGCLRDTSRSSATTRSRLAARRSAGTPGRAAPVRSAWSCSPNLSDAVELWLVRVTYGEEGTELYQLPLVAHPEPVDYLDHVLLGTVDGPDGPVWVYDALHDKDVTHVWVDSIRDERVDGALAVPPLQRRRGTAGRPEQPRPHRRAVEHLIDVRRHRHPEGVPPAAARHQPRHRDRRRAQRARRAARAAAARLGDDRARGRDLRDRDAAGVHDHGDGRVGAGEGERARPDGRGRPARRRGRRRLRRRGAAARRRGRRGARRSRRRVRHHRARRSARPRGRDAQPPRRGDRRSSRHWPNWPTGCARPTTRSPTPRPRCRCSASTATCISARRCARRSAGCVIDFEGEPMADLDAPPPARLAAARRRGHAALVRVRRAPPPRRGRVHAATGLPRDGVDAAQPRRVPRRVRRGCADTTRASTRCRCARSRPTRPSTKPSTKHAIDRRGWRYRWHRSPAWRTPRRTTHDRKHQRGRAGAARRRVAPRSAQHPGQPSDR